MKGHFFLKTYKKDNLLGSKKDIKTRISLINNFDYKNYSSLVKTEIFDNADNYIYKQKYLSVKKTSIIKKEDFLELIRTLKYFELINFIHADLNKKNIVYTQNGFKIIDYEPTLLQIKNNQQQLMITIPYVLKSDLENKIITTSTDKIGFFYFILRINGFFTAMNIVSLAKKMNHKEYIGIREIDLETTSYEELLDRAYVILANGTY